MGYSTPKTPFNLAEFLSQKAKPGASRRPKWRRTAGTPVAKGTETAPAAEAARVAPDAAEAE